MTYSDLKKFPKRFPLLQAAYSIHQTTNKNSHSGMRLKRSTQIGRRFQDPSSALRSKRCRRKTAFTLPKRVRIKGELIGMKGWTKTFFSVPPFEERSCSNFWTTIRPHGQPRAIHLRYYGDTPLGNQMGLQTPQGELPRQPISPSDHTLQGNEFKEGRQIESVVFRCRPT